LVGEGRQGKMERRSGEVGGGGGTGRGAEESGKMTSKGERG